MPLTTYPLSTQSRYWASTKTRLPGQRAEVDLGERLVDRVGEQQLLHAGAAGVGAAGGGAHRVSSAASAQRAGATAWAVRRMGGARTDCRGREAGGVAGGGGAGEGDNWKSEVGKSEVGSRKSEAGRGARPAKLRTGRGFSIPTSHLPLPTFKNHGLIQHAARPRRRGRRGADRTGVPDPAGPRGERRKGVPSWCGTSWCSRTAASCWWTSRG